MQFSRFKLNLPSRLIILCFLTGFLRWFDYIFFTFSPTPFIRHNTRREMLYKGICFSTLCFIIIAKVYNSYLLLYLFSLLHRPAEFNISEMGFCCFKFLTRSISVVLRSDIRKKCDS